MKPEQFALLAITDLPFDYKSAIQYHSWEHRPLDTKSSLEQLDEKWASKRLKEKLDIFGE